MTTNCGPEFGGLLWCHLTPNGETAIWCTTTIPHVHNSPKVVMENVLPVWLLVRTNLFIPSRYWTTCTNFDNLLSALHSDVRKKLYIGAHLHSRS